MAIATINRFITLMGDAFAALSAPVAMSDIERMAMLIHHSMNAKTRVYHTADHVFALSEGMKPRQVLAALFHDLVYYQLDAGFPVLASPLLAGVTRREGSSLMLNEIGPADATLSLCANLFGFAPGQALPLYGGMNEFLSAVVAARCLQPYLTRADLIAVLACIEATIPFRGKAQNGGSAADALAGRIQTQLWQDSLATELPSLTSVAKAMTRDAIALANRDVSGFGERDPGRFLANTWLLMEESNAPLAAVGVYSVQDYRAALMRTSVFLTGLDPHSVFQSYDHEPKSRQLQTLRAAASRNIAFARAFLEAKIASIAIIEALALATGGDAPISMFLGDISSAQGKPERAEDLLPAPPRTHTTDARLLKVLEKGRAIASNKDLTTSPLTAFVYRSVGPEGVQQVVRQARQMFDGHLAAPAFLRELQRDMLRAIIQACAHIALSRRDALLRLEGSC